MASVRKDRNRRNLFITAPPLFANLQECYPADMDDVKPVPEKEFHEGPEVARRFEGIVKQAVSISSAEIKKRDEAWRKERQAKRRKSQKATGVHH